ncbi:MAG: SUMF1/EgtB/PvdO family nonheme iron enzyme [Planctomycetes bacterium]|nr:SUMF1/EgtB/PvdO family nonheme iron enzyme [Planctomycetota bacterium]
MKRLLIVVLIIVASVSAVEHPQVETMRMIMEGTAEPLSPLDTLYVDDNAIGDPGPNDLTVSDPFEDGSQSHPFDSIQEAIDVARDRVPVLVNPGRYTETLNFLGKNLDVNGFEPSHLAMTDYPIIDAMDQGVVVTFGQGENADCRLSGFVLTRGLGVRAGAIFCNNSSPTIEHCLIVGNRCLEGQDLPDPGQGAIYCRDSRALFEHCTIADNAGGKNGSGICVMDSNIVLSHSIVWGNSPTQIQVASGRAPVVFHCCLDDDPLFALPGYWVDAEAPTGAAIDPNDPNAIWLEGDYHVQSLHGRYDRFADDWAYDDLTSDCIDLGDPGPSVEHESAPHGDRVNAGAYGGTWMASRTGKLMFVAIGDPGFVGEMSKYEITNGQYCQYLNEALADQSILVIDNHIYDVLDADLSQPYFETSSASSTSQIAFFEDAFEVMATEGYNMSHHPVTHVSWFGATAFGDYHGSRLPTSIEWQAVADYDGSYTYASGEIIDLSQANFDAENPMGLPGIPYTSPVGYYPIYGYGLCDMAGNVWEWTGGTSGRFRRLHSGAWTSQDVFCTVSSSSGFMPHTTLSNVGFRVCR